MSTELTTHPNFEEIAQSYFDALGSGDFASVPWADDVVLRTPLRSDGPLRGRAAVEAFFRPMAGQLGAIRIMETYLNDRRDTVVAEALVGPLHVVDKFVLRGGQIVEQENIFDPRPALEKSVPGGLSSDERTLLLERLGGSRDRLRTAVEGVSEADWQRRPATGGWSAAECLQHLVLSEGALLGLVREKVLGGVANPGLVAELQGKDGVIVQAMQDRSAKGKTFDFLEPKDQLLGLDAFLARRADTIEYVRACGDAVHYHSAPLPGLGELDAYHWLLLMAVHTDRHVAQLQEALGGSV